MSLPHQVVQVVGCESSSSASLVGVAVNSTAEEVGLGTATVFVFELTMLLTGGSCGLSRTGASSSECRPTGFNGRRRVPLFASGLIPRESQMML